MLLWGAPSHQFWRFWHFAAETPLGVCIVTNGALLAVILVVGPLAVPAGDALPQPRDVVPGLQVVRRHRRVAEYPVQAPVRSLGPPLLFGRSVLMFVELF